MARTPTISPTDSDALVVRVVPSGRSGAQIRKLPPSRPDSAPATPSRRRRIDADLVRARLHGMQSLAGR